ncbi:MAG: ABC transporter ATP-binding protein [Oscillospiraceae bacterium]|nr:ABC transporter ATP-binding protein [Oscillospiraceae bacterium]
MNALTLKNIGKIYNKGKNNACEALKNIDLEIESGELIAVIGQSGSGKSTLLHILGCIDTPTSGELSAFGKQVNFKSTKALADYRNKKIGFVLQDFGLILGETALENVRVPLLFSDIRFSKTRQMALDALNMLGVANLANKRASQLSGGQKQRVAIARALVNDPDIILADEPTGALDSKTAADIIGVFKQINSEGKTVVIVTHDLGIAQQCNRVIKISDGEIILT